MCVQLSGIDYMDIERFLEKSHINCAVHYSQWLEFKDGAHSIVYCQVVTVAFLVRGPVFQKGIYV